MSEDRSESPEPTGGPKPAPSGDGRALPPIPRWKKLLVACSLVSVVLGLSLQAFGGSGDPPATGEGTAQVSPSATGTSPTGLVPQPDGFLPGSNPSTGNPDDVPEADEGASGWSPFFVKGGFSFFVAFCVGYALRTFFKITALAIGAFALGIFGLSYVGVVDVDWITIEGYYDGFVGRIGEQAKSFKTFMTGSLPSTGLAAFGLFTGFRRG